MNIGIDASRSRSGGAISHLRGILSELKPNDHNITAVHVWAPLPLINQLPNRPWLIKHSPKKINQNIFLQLFWQLHEFKKELLKNKCTVLFKTTSSSITHFAPCVTLSQDMLPFEFTEMERYGLTLGRLRLIVLRLIYIHTLKRSYGVIFLTKYAARKIQEVTGKLPNNRVIPHGVDSIFSSMQNKPIKPLPLNEIRCVYVSASAPYKHQWNVIEAIYLLRLKNIPASLDLIGGGSGKSDKRVNEAIRKFDPERRFVNQLPFIKPNEVSKRIQESDIFVFASSCENLPITLLEGMSSGLAIASSDMGPMPEVLGKGGTYFNPEAPQSIADAIELLIKDSSFRSDSINHAINNAKHFSWKECSDNTFHFLVSCNDSKK
ncbi:glycosyltransferase family 4 protein [Pseudomonadota bacterium]|jgi:glycosyltransferase involved in cell wall biosynthesis|nr:glycosyltransferase family 4 protein [Pseudomonadota bacterium]